MLKILLQNERERELRERERRIKEEHDRIERERRAHEEQQRWMREEAARVARVKEEATRIQKEREEAERRDRERRQREEKDRREEEMRLKREQRERERQGEQRERERQDREREREREQKRERDELEKRMQSGSGRLGKRPYQQDNGTFESKRPAYSPNPYPMSNTSSIFNRLEPHKGNHRSGPSQVNVGVSSVPLIQTKDLPHVNPEIISAASQALANIRKSVPSVSSHLPVGRGGGSSLQAQIQQLAAATALASASSRIPNVGMEFRGSSSNTSGPQHFSPNMMRPSMSGRSQGRGLGMMSKSPHIGGGMGGGSGGMGKLPPEDQRYNRRLGGSRSGSNAGSGGYRGHGRQGGGGGGGY